MNKNPIFIEFYPHEGGDCYKVRNPWTNFKEETHVLGPVSMGFAKAKKEASKVLRKILTDALKQPANHNIKHIVWNGEKIEIPDGFEIIQDGERIPWHARELNHHGEWEMWIKQCYSLGDKFHKFTGNNFLIKEKLTVEIILEQINNINHLLNKQKGIKSVKLRVHKEMLEAELRILEG